MKLKRSNFKFSSEEALCDSFLETVPDTWEVYPETGGYDIVLVHKESGFQIAIEAKLRLNPKVLRQILPTSHMSADIGPDLRAVLVGEASEDMEFLARHTGVTVLRMHKSDPKAYSRLAGGNIGGGWQSFPKLPVAKGGGRYVSVTEASEWFDLSPMNRIALPEYVPQVKAGRPSPIVLSDWKISSMKMIYWLDLHGSVTRRHFRNLRLNATFWMDHKHLKQGSNRGEWVGGQFLERQKSKLVSAHPEAWEQIKRDYGKWQSDISR
jgi:hypothetical protein